MKNTTQHVIAKNIRKYLELRDMTQTELADLLEINPSSVTLWLKEKTTPRAEMVDKICKALNITRAELVQDPDALAKEYTSPKYIPLYNSIYSEHKYFDDSNVERYLTVDQTVKADFGIIVSSQSMSDAGIWPGDVAFFTKDYDYTDGRIYAVWILNSEQVILKKVYRDSDRYILMSENANMSPLSVAQSDVLIIGELFGIYKEWKWDK